MIHTFDLNFPTKNSEWQLHLNRMSFDHSSVNVGFFLLADLNLGSTLRAHTISIVEQPRRTVVNPNTYTPPSPSEVFTCPQTKPPLPRRVASSLSSTSAVSSDPHGSTGEQV